MDERSDSGEAAGSGTGATGFAERADSGADADEALRVVATLLGVAEVLGRSVASSQAAQMAAILQSVLLARRCPQMYVLANPGQPRAEAIRLAERSVVWELSSRLCVAEATVWNMFHEADVLAGRLPRIWHQFQTGSIGYANARTAAIITYGIPTEDPRAFETLDETLVGKASRLVPSLFRKAARAARERVHPVDPIQRHQDARRWRRVEAEPGEDGMAWLTLYTDAAVVRKIQVRLHEAALAKRAVTGEERTVAQLEADTAGDVLTGRGTPWEVRSQIHVTIPVTALLDRPELLEQARVTPAVLDGFAPFDDATARMLAADAPSF
jgi:hypothetical protein